MVSFKAKTLKNLLKENALWQIPQLRTYYDENTSSNVSYSKLTEGGPVSVNPPVLTDYYLVHGAKITDVMVGDWLSEDVGLFVSSKMKALLEKFQLGRHAFYQVPIRPTNPEDGEEDEPPLEYYFFHLASESDDNIDYSESLLVDEVEQDRVLSISSTDDIEKEKDDLNFPLWKKITLKKPRDVFRVYNTIEIYISPDFASEVEKLEITGVILSPDYHGLEVNIK